MHFEAPPGVDVQGGRVPHDVYSSKGVESTEALPFYEPQSDHSGSDAKVSQFSAAGLMDA